ncbi:phage tail tube protein [Burkholderia pseudomallei]|uniref:phage tail tube protein n=1 Tax=Burkholderia pseudomallei TaxID=28450 RepID=UPI000A1A1AB8|nr:phage tail tube protein [Burkholderia pseudomallei]ARK44739.1 phage tail protein [Burkholderia pseudomallei]ARK89683.1 phage tail protein [Burkholderia pseudomallei]ARL57953.1 phage tail protein [Burkholderia pseudomallei]ARL64935.1 phage tail protein [Burkholderia pseudomallei]ARL91588.1 phage tail protein [Burkholderia pseudomallei]
MADNTNRLAGIAFISVDGQNYMLQGDLTYRVSTIERESLIGQDTVHGYSEKPSTGMISGTLRDAKNLSVASFNSMTNSTVVLQLANGKTIIGRSMWCVDVQEVKTAEATFEVKFEGPFVSEN